MNINELLELTIKVLEDYYKNAEGEKDAYSNLVSPMIIGMWKEFLDNTAKKDGE